MITKHTPGPWKLSRSTSKPKTIMVAEGRNVGLELATVHDFLPEYRAESDANARVMVASPELLAALEDLRSYAATQWFDEATAPDDERAIMQKAKAAIDKAKGVA